MGGNKWQIYSLAKEVTNEYACMRGYDCVCLTCLVFERLCCPIEKDSKGPWRVFPSIFFLSRENL